MMAPRKALFVFIYFALITAPVAVLFGMTTSLRPESSTYGVLNQVAGLASRLKTMQGYVVSYTGGFLQVHWSDTTTKHITVLIEQSLESFNAFVENTKNDDHWGNSYFDDSLYRRSILQLQEELCPFIAQNHFHADENMVVVDTKMTWDQKAVLCDRLKAQGVLNPDFQRAFLRINR